MSSSRKGEEDQGQAGPGQAGQGSVGREQQGGPRMGHAPKERFLQTPEFKAVHEEQYRALCRELLGDGAAAGRPDEIVASCKRDEGADATEADAEAETPRTPPAARIEAPAANEVVTGAWTYTRNPSQGGVPRSRRWTSP